MTVADGGASEHDGRMSLVELGMCVLLLLLLFVCGVVYIIFGK